MLSWVRGEEQGLKSTVWDSARGALLADRQEGSWRYLSGPVHRKLRPRGPPLPCCHSRSCFAHLLFVASHLSLQPGCLLRAHPIVLHAFHFHPL